MVINNENPIRAGQREGTKMLIWAHRGASAYAPENTITAFEKAIHMKADGIELDVHLSRDGELMVCHDEKIDRCSSGTGEVCAMSVSQLKQYDYSFKFRRFRGETIPTLREVLELVAPSGLLLNIELKTNVNPYPGIEEKCLALVDEYGMSDRVMYSSFNSDSLGRMHALSPGTKLGLLYKKHTKGTLLRAKQAGATALHPEFHLCYQDKYVENMHSKGYALNVWTPNASSDFWKLAELDVDGVITNQPDIARRVAQGEKALDSIKEKLRRIRMRLRQST